MISGAATRRRPWLARGSAWRGAATGLLAASLVSAGADAGAAGTCTPGGVLEAGRYWLHNNQWGRDSGAGEQCLWTVPRTDEAIAWSTRWNWSGSSSAVKSWGSAVLGWHWGWRRAGTGLPVRLSALRGVPTSAQYQVAGDGTARVGYGLWIHGTAGPAATDDPSDEVAIWTHRSGGTFPLGSRQATVTIGGTSWDLYRGNAGWNVFTFVRTSNTGSVSLDLAEFVSELVSRGWLGKSKYLTGVEHGVEVLSGTARLDVRSYSLSVQ